MIRYILVLAFVPWLVFAQGSGNLPTAGITPESSFYFLDKLGEVLQEFFTFNQEGKARLQITFAAERIAEIKIILETKGVEAKGLEVAQARLKAHLGDAAEIIIKHKGKGKDVKSLAKELNDELEASKSALEDSFKAEKEALKDKKEELKDQLKTVRRASDTAKVEAIVQELGQVKAQLELLGLKEGDIEDELEVEEEKIEEEIEELEKKQENKEEAEEAIKEAEEEKQEVLDEAREEGIELPPTVFAKFDRLLAQAKELFAKENYQGVEQLAEQAENSLDEVENVLEKLEEKMEKQKEQSEGEDELQEEINMKEKEGDDEEKDDDYSGESILPTSGNAIIIKDCKASPKILQVRKGTEIAIRNSDDEAHMLSFYDFATGGQGSLKLPAKGSIKTAKLSMPANTTNNFSCDNKSLPYGGAVFVQP